MTAHTNLTPRSVTDTLHDLLNAAETLREMREEAEATVAAVEARFANNRAAYWARRDGEKGRG